MTGKKPVGEKTLRKQFRRDRPGPELVLQNTLSESLDELFPFGRKAVWTGYSVPVGAGHPDIVITSCLLSTIADEAISSHGAGILSYMRAVRSARKDTIAKRLDIGGRALDSCLDLLTRYRALNKSGSTYSLNDSWRYMPEIIAIEVKHSSWQKAVLQASRNLIFSHRSFIAVPEKVAAKVKSNSALMDSGIGIIGIDDDGNVRVTKRARKSSPKVWSYSYAIALMAAEHWGEARFAIRHKNRASRRMVSGA